MRTPSLYRDRCRVNPEIEDNRGSYLIDNLPAGASDEEEWDRVETEANTKNPCQYHLTPEEYRELANSGVG